MFFSNFNKHYRLLSVDVPDFPDLLIPMINEDLFEVKRTNSESSGVKWSLLSTVIVFFKHFTLPSAVIIGVLLALLWLLRKTCRRRSRRRLFHSDLPTYTRGRFAVD